MLYSAIQMTLSCIIRVKLWGTENLFQAFRSDFSWGLQCCSSCFRRRRGRSWKGSLCIITHSLQSNSQRPFPRDGVHTHTHTHKGCMCARTASHTDTHHTAIHLRHHGNINAQAWGNICMASRRMEWLEKSKSDLWPSQPRPSLFTLRSFRGPAAAW